MSAQIIHFAKSEAPRPAKRAAGLTYHHSVLAAFLPFHMTAYALVLSGLFLVKLAENAEQRLGVRR